MQRELRDGERIGVAIGSGRPLAASSTLARGITLVISGGIDERALRLDVGLLGAEAADQLEPALQQLEVSAEIAATTRFRPRVWTGSPG